MILIAFELIIRDSFNFFQPLFKDSKIDYMRY